MLIAHQPLGPDLKCSKLSSRRDCVCWRPKLSGYQQSLRFFVDQEVFLEALVLQPLWCLESVWLVPRTPACAAACVCRQSTARAPSQDSHDETIPRYAFSFCAFKEIMVSQVLLLFSFTEEDGFSKNSGKFQYLCHGNTNQRRTPGIRLYWLLVIRIFW